MDFGKLVETTRSKNFKNPREYYTQSGLSCSYYYYSTVEKGKSVPSVDLAFEIMLSLKIDKRRGLLAWARSQMPDVETKSVFADVGEQADPPIENMPTSKTLVINRHQAQFLAKNPLIMEILTFINLKEAVTTKGVAKYFQSSESSIKVLLAKLFDLGLVDKDATGNFIAREWLFVPFTKEYEELNDSIFLRAYQQFQRNLDPHKTRYVATVNMTEDQRFEMEAKIKSLLNWCVANSLNENKKSIPYTIGIFGSRRLFGDDK